MSYPVEFTSAAARAFSKLTQQVQKQLQGEINELAVNPRSHGCKKLKGHSNRWRVRSGDYRVVYEVQDGLLLVLIVDIGHRSSIYN
ncbi:MAG: type II toxin-antitoxin system RelE/ParE family toxin [Verrucomicrobiaceae bacterium]|nr:type II toxin-antitoxin system RelE/ParE family toxin [Verrucomicrobiaceae bacterium]